MFRFPAALFLLLGYSTFAGQPAAAAIEPAGGLVAEAPPPLPVYRQPAIPADGYLWAPGYWEHRAAGYYWVPGAWVRPPGGGMMWTPAYWRRVHRGFVFVPGYWGREVGFYGDIDYGNGYGGFDYEGAEWSKGRLRYNTAVNNLSAVRVGAVYRRAITYPLTVDRVSFNGSGGAGAVPTARQLAYARERHQPETAVQAAIEQAARHERTQLASFNHGRPPVLAIGAT